MPRISVSSAEIRCLKHGLNWVQLAPPNLLAMTLHGALLPSRHELRLGGADQLGLVLHQLDVPRVRLAADRVGRQALRQPVLHPESYTTSR